MATRSWNRVELIGNLTRDPELRYTPNGSAVVTFTIATNRTFVSDGEKREEADFHKIVAWAKLAELCSQLLKKGNRVFVSGRLQNRSWEGQDGQQRQTTEIVIEDMILLTSKSGGESYEEAHHEESTPSRSADEMPKSPVESAESDKPASPAKRGESESKAEEPAAEEPKSAPAANEKIDDKELDDLPF